MGCALVRVELPLREATAEQLADLLREREAEIRTMKGLFRAQIKGPGIPIAQRLEGAVYYRRPSSLRLQGFNQMGGELFEFVLGDDLYRLRLPAMGRVFSGRLADLDRMGKLGRPFQLSLWAMNGAVGIISVPRDAGLLLSEDGDQYRLDVLPSREVDSSVETGPVRRIWFDRRFLQVVREDRLTSTGEVEATIEFEDFRPVGSPPPDLAVSIGSPAMSGATLRPFKITTQDGRGRGTLVLTFHEIVLNPHLEPNDLGVAGIGLGARGDRL